MYLDELAEELESMHDISVSVATLSRTLKQLGLSNKKLSCLAHERNQEDRSEFRRRMANDPPERLVFADESAVNVLTTYRMNGWSLKGHRARKKTKFVRGKR